MVPMAPMGPMGYGGGGVQTVGGTVKVRASGRLASWPRSGSRTRAMALRDMLGHLEHRGYSIAIAQKWRPCQASSLSTVAWETHSLEAAPSRPA